MTDVPILIPTYGRAHPVQQHTLRQFPKYLWKRTWLVVRPEELSAYRDVHRQLIDLPRYVKEVSTTRQWILEYAAYHDWEKVFVVDDDLDFYMRRAQKRGRPVKLVPCEPDDLIEMFDILENWLDNYIHAGISTKWGNTLIKSPYQEVAKATCVFALRPGEIVDAGVSFATHKKGLGYLRSDSHFLMQMFLKGLPNRVSMEFAHDQHEGYQAEGGCSTYRTGDSFNKGTTYFAKLYPNYVTVIDHKGSHDESQGKWRMRTRVAWKKAYKHGCESKNALI